MSLMNDKSSTSLRFQLTFWFSLITLSLLSLTFSAFYFWLHADLEAEMELELAAEMEEWGHVFENSGLPGIAYEFESEMKSLGSDRCYCRFFDADLKLLAASELKNWNSLPLPPEDFLQNTPANKPYFANLLLTDQQIPVSVVYWKSSSGNIQEFGLTTDIHDSVMSRVVRASVSCILLTSLLAGAAGYLLSRRSLRGLDELNNAIDSMAKADFSYSLPDALGAEEVDRLASSFNAMQSQISTLIRELREMSSDIAHDLKSPLTRIRCAAETTLVNKHSQEEADETLAVTLEECDRLIGLLNTLLSISRLDAGIIDELAKPADLTEVINAMGELFRPAVFEQGLEFHVSTPDEQLLVKGPSSDLQRAIANLLDNARKFTNCGGCIFLSLKRNQDHAIIQVRDNGLGIQEKDLPQIFSRFYRGDHSRSTPGNGLGLSMVLAVVKAHKGTIDVQSTPGKGTKFTLTFPLLTK